MRDSMFDAVSRSAGEAVTRRSSLLTLGGAALAAVLAAPVVGVAGKSNKNKNKDKQQKQKVQKQARKLCQKQVGECKAFLAESCEAGASCAVVIEVCCPLLGSCQNGAFWTCLVDGFSTT
jgi:hypothetical protein